MHEAVRGRHRGVAPKPPANTKHPSVMVRPGGKSNPVLPYARPPRASYCLGNAICYTIAQTLCTQIHQACCFVKRCEKIAKKIERKREGNHIQSPRDGQALHITQQLQFVALPSIVRNITSYCKRRIHTHFCLNIPNHHSTLPHDLSQRSPPSGPRDKQEKYQVGYHITDARWYIIERNS